MAIGISAWLLAVSLLLVSASAIDSKNNPADELVAMINSNRTAQKSTTLYDNPGLGCIALQYIKAYQGQCADVGPNGKKPSDSDFADTFAPSCGVESTTLSTITGRLLGCQTKYVPPSQAFSEILIQNGKSLELIDSKNHTQVGVAVSGSDGGSPYFWCVLFSGGKPNSTFVLAGGVVKTVHPGCFSGNNDDCSHAESLYRRSFRPLYVGVLVAITAYVFGF